MGIRWAEGHLDQGDKADKIQMVFFNQEGKIIKQGVSIPVKPGIFNFILELGNIPSGQ